MFFAISFDNLLCKLFPLLHTWHLMFYVFSVWDTSFLSWLSFLAAFVFIVKWKFKQLVLFHTGSKTNLSSTCLRVVHRTHFCYPNQYFSSLMYNLQTQWWKASRTKVKETYGTMSLTTWTSTCYQFAFTQHWFRTMVVVHKTVYLDRGLLEFRQ